MMPCLENTKNRLALVLMHNMRRTDEFYDMIRAVNSKCKSICYVCLSTPHTDLINSLKAENIDYGNFVFVDAISSDAQKCAASGTKCIFTSKPDDLEGIKKAVKHAVAKDGCKLTIFDAISTLLVYHAPDSIVRFTHDLITDDQDNTIKKVFIILKSEGIYKDENRRLVDDLNLFADRVVDIE